MPVRELISSSFIVESIFNSLVVRPYFAYFLALCMLISWRRTKNSLRVEQSASSDRRLELEAKIKVMANERNKQENFKQKLKALSTTES
jgi:hypothetical protein